MITNTGNGHSTVVTGSIVDTQCGGETGIDSNELDVVRAQFEQWRCRPGRRHIPDDLWLAAIRLLDYYPVSVVSEHLRLNSARLQQQQHKLLSLPSPVPSTHSTPSRRSAGTKSKRKRTDDNLTTSSQPPIEFLQLSPQNRRDPLSTGQTACSIAIERNDGSRLTVRLPADLSIIESLWARFLGVELTP